MDSRMHEYHTNYPGPAAAILDRAVPIMLEQAGTTAVMHCFLDDKVPVALTVRHKNPYAFYSQCIIHKLIDVAIMYQAWRKQFTCGLASLNSSQNVKQRRV